MTEPQTTEAPIDPSKTPEAASGKVDWNFTYPFILDSGEEVHLPYLAPSFAEINRVKSMSETNSAESALDTMRRYLGRRIGENTELYNKVADSMDFKEFGSYIEWCANPTNRTPGKVS